MEVNEIIQGLKKRVNVSADAEVTMERARETWRGLSNAQKQEVLTLADVGQSVAHNTYKNGHLGAPIAIAMAKTAGINPAYLAAQTDRKGRFTPKTVNAFLSTLGYDVADEPSAEDANPELESVSEESAEISEEPAAVECGACEPSDGPDTEFAPTAMLLDDDLYILLKALLIKAQVSDEAKKTLAEIQELLIR